MIYVVDASDQSRLEENLEVLGEVIGHDKSKGKPILVLANKQDIPNAVDKDRLVKQLQLHSLLTSNQNPYRVVSLNIMTAISPQHIILIDYLVLIK